jgi:biopolymer transport protein TolR
MGMSLGGGQSTRKAVSEINVTPLVDVMLVLLIIFMVSTPLIVKENSERLVEINLPVTQDNPTTVDVNNTDKFILTMDAQLRTYVGNELINDCSAAVGITDMTQFVAITEPCFTEIGVKLGNVPRIRDEGIYVQAEAMIPYGFFVGAMNRIRQSGVSRVGMITASEVRLPAAGSPTVTNPNPSGAAPQPSEPAPAANP